MLGMAQPSGQGREASGTPPTRARVVARDAPERGYDAAMLLGDAIHLVGLCSGVGVPHQAISILHLSLVGFALPLCLSQSYDLARGAPTSGVIPSNDPAHQEIYQTRVMIDPIL